MVARVMIAVGLVEPGKAMFQILDRVGLLALPTPPFWNQAMAQPPQNSARRRRQALSIRIS